MTRIPVATWFPAGASGPTFTTLAYTRKDRERRPPRPEVEERVGPGGRGHAPQAPDERAEPHEHEGEDDPRDEQRPRGRRQHSVHDSGWGRRHKRRDGLSDTRPAAARKD